MLLCLKLLHLLLIASNRLLHLAVLLFAPFPLLRVRLIHQLVILHLECLILGLVLISLRRLLNSVIPTCYLQMLHSLLQLLNILIL